MMKYWMLFFLAMSIHACADGELDGFDALNEPKNDASSLNLGDMPVVKYNNKVMPTDMGMPKDTAVDLEKDMGTKPEDMGIMPNDLGMKPEDMGMDSKDMSMDVEDMTPDLPQKDSCEHTTEDGVYGHLGCSLSYQCCDGAWKTRANGCGTCACIEATGKIGCSGS